MLNFYCLHDLKTGHYYVPFYAHTDPEALSMIRDQVSSGQCPSLVDALPDLELYKIGTFAPEAGSFESVCEVVDFDLKSFRAQEVS